MTEVYVCSRYCVGGGEGRRRTANKRAGGMDGLNRVVGGLNRVSRGEAVGASVDLS